MQIQKLFEQGVVCVIFNQLYVQGVISTKLFHANIAWSIRPISYSRWKTTILDKNVPYIIKSANPISVINKDSEDLYEPTLKDIIRTLTHTYLTQKQIHSLNTIQLLNHMSITDMYDNYIYIGSITSGVIILVVVCILIVVKRNQILLLIVKRTEEQENTQRRAANYKMNRQILKTTEITA
jgi:hypothetical protein